MRLELSPALAPELASALGDVARELEGSSLAGAYPDVVAFAGTVDPLLVARAPGPIVAVPVLGAAGGRTPAVARARAIGALTPADAGTVTGRPVIPLGLPRPAPSSATGPIDHGPGAAALARALAAEAEHALRGSGGPGVTWISGSGALPLARAAAAWAAGRAVVALAGTAPAPLLERAGCPRADDALGAIELTRLLLSAPPLARLLARRGQTALAGLPSAGEVALAVLEAALIASEQPVRAPLVSGGRAA